MPNNSTKKPTGKGGRKGASRQPAGKRHYTQSKTQQQLSSSELAAIKQWAKEREEEEAKEERRNLKLQARKSASKMVSSFAKANNLEFSYSTSSSSDSEDTSDDEDIKWKKKKAKKKKNAKERKKTQLQVAADNKARVEELEAELKLCKQQGTSEKQLPPRQAMSIVTTPAMLQSKVYKAVTQRKGCMPKGFKMPFPNGQDIEFNNKEDLESAIELMVEAALNRFDKPEKKTVVKFDKRKLMKQLTEGSPASTSAAPRPSRSRPRVMPTLSAVSGGSGGSGSEDDVEEGNDPMSGKTEGRLMGSEKDSGVTVYHYIMPEEGTEDTLSYLTRDAKARDKHDKISAKHFSDTFKTVMEKQARDLVKGKLSHAKAKVKQIIKELKLEKYLTKSLDKATAPEMVTVILCAIRAIPSGKLRKCVAQK